MKDQRGFLLIEVLIAMVILAFGILAVGKMHLNSISGNSFSSKLTRGITLAQGELEQLIAMDYDNTNLRDTDGDGTNQDNNADGIDDNGGDFGLNDNTKASADHYSEPAQVKGKYIIYWNIAVDEPILETKTIRVIVTWNQRGVSKEVSIDTIKSRSN